MEKIKRNSWVGNIYHKFEAMCQEVDEFVTKDTVRYVENRVQTVGEGMKKLYSGVVQDYLIPTDDPVKKGTQLVNGKESCVVGTCTSSVTGTTQNPIKERSYPDKDADNSIESNHAATSTELDGLVASEEAEVDFSVGNDSTTISGKVCEENVTRENEPVDEHSHYLEDNFPSESCPYRDSEEAPCYNFSDDDKCFSDISNSLIILQDDIVTDKQEMAEGSSLFVDNLSISQRRASEDTNISITPTILQDNITIGTIVPNSSLLPEYSHVSTSSTGNCTQGVESGSTIFASCSSSSSPPVKTKNDAVASIASLSSAQVLTDFTDINASRSHELVRSAGSIENDLDWCPSPQLKALIPPAEIGCINGCCDLPGMETIDLTDKGKLGESCVLVGNQLHNTVSFRPRKYKSYKELIQEAFASRKRLIKEYKQLAVLYADVDAETGQHAVLSRLPSLPSSCLPSTESPKCNICESGWELL